MSGSDSESNRSISPSGPAPTPGYRLDKSRSNSPDFDAKSLDSRRPESRQSSRSGSRRSHRSSSHSRSRSNSAASNKSGSQRSQSGGSNKSGSARSRSGSRGSNRSGSHTSNRSGSQVSNQSGSKSPGSNRTRSHSSNRSGSVKSGGSDRSGSHSAASHRSRSKSAASRRSRSASRRSQSKSPASQRSRSKSAASRRSRSKSAGSARSHSKSPGSVRSRSKSAGSARSRSKTPGSARSRSKTPGSVRSRSKSAESNRSRSRSAASNRSVRSRSKSAASNRSGSAESHRSRSKSVGSHRSKSGSQRSNSPNLEIDAGSPHSEQGDKRKRDSSPEGDVKKKTKNHIIDTDSEEEKAPEPEADAADLFGDADDISSEEDKDKDDSDTGRDGPRDRLSGDERRGSDEENEHAVIDDEEKENEPEPIPETRIDVRIPKISCDLGREIHFVKLPNFLSVETRPFDAETYEDEIDEEETLDEEGRARLKLKVENTIRWREVVSKEGDLVKESNARIVRWSDGSLSLHLGSEIFDVYKQPLQGDHNHLFIRQGTGLQGQAVFRTKLSFRPHSTESFTHRKMTLSLADRSQKTSGIKILSQVGIDPDQDRKTLLKKEEEKLRQTVRVTKPRKRGEGGTRSHGTGNAYREEEGSDEEGISLNAIKNKYKSGAAGGGGGGSSSASTKGGAIYSSDEEGSDFEARRSRKSDKPRALKDSESSEDSD